MISLPNDLPNDPAALKQLLLKVQEEVVALEKEAARLEQRQQDYQQQIIKLQEQNTLLIQRLFGRKSEQSSDPNSPQLEIFNEAESLAEVVPEASVEEFEEEVVAPVVVAAEKGKTKAKKTEKQNKK